MHFIEFQEDETGIPIERQFQPTRMQVPGGPQMLDAVLVSQDHEARGIVAQTQCLGHTRHADVHARDID